MPQPQPQQNIAFFDNANSSSEFSVVLRGYDRAQVDDFIGRLNGALTQSEQARTEAEQRMNEAQRRLRQAEQRLNSVEQKLTDTNKQLEENSRPTLSGLGTRVEQILRLAEEQANDHRSEAKRESEGILSAARLEAREITDKARA
jgi:DivIVA domain-containing protein